MDHPTGAPLRAVSGSQHSGVDKLLKDSFFYKEKSVGVEDVFEETSGFVDEQFVTTVMKSLAGATTERQLQDGVFNAMNRLSTIHIPDECKKKPKEKERSILETFTSYRNPASFQEKDMRTILSIYAAGELKGLIGEDVIPKMSDAEPGLFVRATSRPDVAGTVTIIETAEDEEIDGADNSSELQEAEDADGDAVTGEVKNADNFTVRDALMQEGAYLMLMLYWWRVFARREAQTVYGFTICGPLCRDLKKRKRRWNGKPIADAHYSICLLKLLSPATLGTVPSLSFYQGRSKLSDDSDVRTFCKFLTSPKVWTKKNATKMDVAFPALFNAPRNFCEKMAASQTEGHGWSVVPNGTAALVFRCIGKKGVENVMALTDKKTRQHTFYKKWMDYIEGKDDEIFYVKVSTAATARTLSTSALFWIRGVAKNIHDGDFLRTYPVPAIANSRSCFVLMADRGQPVDKDMQWDVEDFNGMFKALWEKTVKLSDAATHHHGDIAKHNILIENARHGSKQLVLVDWDEALEFPKSRESLAKEYLVLIYPDCLRQHPELYTKVQLALLYRRLRWEHTGDNKDSWLKQKNSIPGLKDYYDGLKHFNDASSADNNAIEQAAIAFVRLVEKELEIEPGVVE